MGMTATMLPFCKRFSIVLRSGISSCSFQLYDSILHVLNLIGIRLGSCDATQAGGSRAGGEWYRIFFTGISWDDDGNACFDREEHGIHEVDITDGGFQKLEEDPLAATCRNVRWQHADDNYDTQ